MIPRDALQDAGSLALGCGLRLLQGRLGGFHALLERIELALADALDAQAQCGLLADDELVLRFVPLACAVSGKAAHAHRFVAHAHRAAFGLELAIEQDLGFQADAGGDRAGQLAGVGDVGRDHRLDGLLIRRTGRDPGQGEFLAGQARRGGLELQDGVVAPGGASLVGVDAVLEFGPQAVGYFAELAGSCLDGVGQAAGQVGQGVDLGAALAEHVTHGAVAAVLAVDVGFEAGLVGVELALQGGGVEVLYPAFGLVGLGALLGGIQEGVGIQRHCGSQIHAGLEGVLLEAAVHEHPGVGLALAGHVPGAATRLCDTSPALSLAPMHPTWNKEGSAFDHQNKTASKHRPAPAWRWPSARGMLCWLAWSLRTSYAFGLKFQFKTFLLGSRWVSVNGQVTTSRCSCVRHFLEQARHIKIDQSNNILYNRPAL